jgi:hypothetical protein
MCSASLFVMTVTESFDTPGSLADRPNAGGYRPATVIEALPPLSGTSWTASKSTRDLL